MKITKKQLKRIIAEEHRLVYGKKPRGTRRRRPLTLEAKKRSVKKEYRYAILAEELFHDGVYKTTVRTNKKMLAESRQLNEFRALRKLKNFFSSAKANLDAVKGTAVKMKDDFDKYMSNIGSEQAKDAALKKQQAITKQIQDLVKSLTQELMSDIEGAMTDEEKEAYGDSLPDQLKTMAGKALGTALTQVGVKVEQGNAENLKSVEEETG